MTRANVTHACYVPKHVGHCHLFFCYKCYEFDYANLFWVVDSGAVYSIT